MLHDYKPRRRLRLTRQSLVIISIAAIVSAGAAFHILNSKATPEAPQNNKVADFTPPKDKNDSAEVVDNTNDKPAEAIANNANANNAQEEPAGVTLTNQNTNTAKPAKSNSGSAPKPVSTPTSPAKTTPITPPAETAPIPTPAPAPIPTPVPQPPSNQSAVDQIIDLINTERTKNGLSAVVANNQLNSAALAKSKDMNDNNYFAHTSPTGVSDNDFISQSGYKYQSIGMNLAEGEFTSNTALIQAWMNSPGHQANILADYGQEIGIGIYGKYYTMFIAKPL